MGPQPRVLQPMGPKPMQLLSMGPHLRKFQPKDVSLYKSLGIKFYEPLFLLNSIFFNSEKIRVT